MAAFGSAGGKGYDSTSLASMVPAYYLPDQMRVLKDPADLLTIFTTQLINLLVSDSGQARDVARDALGSEIDPRLYSRILRELDQ